jgi:hypothetical protein
MVANRSLWNEQRRGSHNRVGSENIERYLCHWTVRQRLGSSLLQVTFPFRKISVLHLSLPVDFKPSQRTWFAEVACGLCCLSGFIELCTHLLTCFLC